MNFVVQEDKNGCAIACIAMVLGVTYEEACQRVPKKCRVSGTKSPVLIRALRSAGYLGIKRPGLAKRSSPIHLICVAWSNAPQSDTPRHLVLDFRGVIYDPAGRIHPDLTSYPYICYTVEVFPLPLE